MCVCVIYTCHILTSLTVLGGFSQAQTRTQDHRTGCTLAATLIGNTQTVLISTDEEVQVQRAEVSFLTMHHIVPNRKQ